MKLYSLGFISSVKMLNDSDQNVRTHKSAKTKKNGIRYLRF